MPYTVIRETKFFIIQGRRPRVTNILITGHWMPVLTKLVPSVTVQTPIFKIFDTIHHPHLSTKIALAHLAVMTILLTIHLNNLTPEVAGVPTVIAISRLVIPHSLRI